MPCAPTWISSAASSRRRSPRARAPSTFRTPWATAFRSAGAISSASCSRASPTPTRRSGPRTATTTSGMAVANSLAAVMAGARQVECTINGLGERAGNASLEEIVMAVKTRADIFPCTTRIDATQIVAGEQARLHDHRLSGAAQQGRRRAPTPSRTSRASTRTACSSIARPTRSCAPPTWAGARTASRWASSRDAAPSRRACRSWASRLHPRSS